MIIISFKQNTVNVDMILHLNLFSGIHARNGDSFFLYHSCPFCSFCSFCPFLLHLIFVRSSLFFVRSGVRLRTIYDGWVVQTRVRRRRRGQQLINNPGDSLMAAWRGRLRPRPVQMHRNVTEIGDVFSRSSSYP